MYDVRQSNSLFFKSHLLSGKFFNRNNYFFIFFNLHFTVWFRTSTFVVFYLISIILQRRFGYYSYTILFSILADILPNVSKLFDVDGVFAWGILLKDGVRTGEYWLGTSHQPGQALAK